MSDYIEITFFEFFGGDIENLFTPEFRNKLGSKESDLRKRIDEGIK